VFDIFTDRAKRAIVASQDEAIALGHDFIGTEHILLGLAGTQDSPVGEVLGEAGVALPRAREETVRILEASGVFGNGAQDAKDALSTLGIDVEEIQKRADDTFGPGAFRFPRPAYTPRAKKALELTLRESRALEHDHIGTEHILLGILAEGEGVAITVLNALEVDLAALRPAVLARAEGRES
jgi:ATP-dependent Clp protease ATP-binding subunit ClpA